VRKAKGIKRRFCEEDVCSFAIKIKEGMRFIRLPVILFNGKLPSSN
jgi:hypothetical protein